MRQRKTITQDSIYVVQQFSYVHRVAGISLFMEKNTRYSSTIFSLRNNTQNPNLQNNSFLSCTGFTMGYKMDQKIFSGALPLKPPRRLVHERSTPWTKPQKISH